jgi:hypothetical protein
MNKRFQEIQKSTQKLETLVFILKYKKDEKNCNLRKRRNW